MFKVADCVQEMQTSMKSFNARLSPEGQQNNL